MVEPFLLSRIPTWNQATSTTPKTRMCLQFYCSLEIKVCKQTFPGNVVNHAEETFKGNGLKTLRKKKQSPRRQLRFHASYCPELHGFVPFVSCLGRAGSVATPLCWHPYFTSQWLHGSFSSSYVLDLSLACSQTDGYFGSCKKVLHIRTVEDLL